MITPHIRFEHMWYMLENCAGYLANVYLYAYELQFIRQIAAACTPSNRLSSAVSSAQQLTAQKIPTAFTFTIPYAKSMMYTPLTMHTYKS